MAPWRVAPAVAAAVACYCGLLNRAHLASAAPIRIALDRHTTTDSPPFEPYTPITPQYLAVKGHSQSDSDSRRSAEAFRSLRAIPTTKTVRLKNYGNVQYVGRVAFGNPPQQLTVVFDTGSSDTWVPGTGCLDCGSHTLFDYTASTTFLDTQEKFIDAYGSGSVSGTVVVDTVALGGYKVDSVKFGVITDETEKLQAFLADGIFGLGFEGLAQISRPTLFTSLARQNPAVDNMFAFYLTPDAYSAGSELHIGGYDLSVVGPNASFHYTPVVKLPEYDTFMYWTVKMNHFSARNTTGLNLCSPFCYAIVDTGTSLISVPEGQYDAVLAMITDGLHCEDVACEGVRLSDFPMLHFGMVPDNMFQLQPRDYVQCAGWGQCRLQLQSTTDEWWILGDVFIKTYYTLFDAENMRVGFACDGDVCTGGRGDIYGGYDDEDPFFHALKNAFLIGSCVAAACMFLFVFYMNQQDEDGDANDATAMPPPPHPHHSTRREFSGQNDPKIPLLYNADGSDRASVGGSTGPPVGGYVAPHPTLVILPGQRRTSVSKSIPAERPPVVATSYEEARRNFHALPSPQSIGTTPSSSSSL